LIGDSCDDGTEGCSSGLICKEDSCNTLCSDSTPCVKTGTADVICISPLKFCDENYQACSYDLPTDPNATYSIVYERPSITEIGTCYDQVDMGSPGDQFVSPECTDLSLVCPYLHCADYGMCQPTRGGSTSCGTDSSCLAYLEYCSDSKYRFCQFEEYELYPYMKSYRSKRRPLLLTREHLL